MLISVRGTGLELRPDDGSQALAADDGTAELTSHRLLFRPSAQAVAPFGAVALPLPLLEGAEFRQPWFAANQFAGVCRAAGPGARGASSFVLTFTNGGGDGFWTVWATIVARRAVQRNPTASEAAVGTAVDRDVTTSAAIREDGAPYSVVVPESGGGTVHAKKNA